MKSLSTIAIFPVSILLAFGCVDSEEKVAEPVSAPATESLSSEELANDSAEEQFAREIAGPELALDDQGQESESSTELAEQSEEGEEPMTAFPKEEQAAEAEEEKSKAKPTLDPAEGITRSLVSCDLDNDQRTITVVDKAPSGCGVNYKKSGFHRQVAWANYDMSYCSEASDRIQGNLTAGGFTCTSSGETLSEVNLEVQQPEAP